MGYASWVGAGWYDPAEFAEPVNYFVGQPVSGDAYVQSLASVEPLLTAGSAELTEDEDWQPLGVFGLIPEGDDDIVYTVQLAVTRHGIVRGFMSTIDSDESSEVDGSVDAATLRLAFAVPGNNTLQFESSVPNLAQAESFVNVYNPVDRTGTVWQMVREESPPDELEQLQER